MSFFPTIANKESQQQLSENLNFQVPVSAHLVYCCQSKVNIKTLVPIDKSILDKYASKLLGEHRTRGYFIVSNPRGPLVV